LDLLIGLDGLSMWMVACSVFLGPLVLHRLVMEHFTEHRPALWTWLALPSALVTMGIVGAAVQGQPSGVAGLAELNGSASNLRRLVGLGELLAGIWLGAAALTLAAVLFPGREQIRVVRVVVPVVVGTVIVAMQVRLMSQGVPGEPISAVWSVAIPMQVIAVCVLAVALLRAEGLHLAALRRAAVLCCAFAIPLLWWGEAELAMGLMYQPVGEVAFEDQLVRVLGALLMAVLFCALMPVQALAVALTGALHLRQVTHYEWRGVAACVCVPSLLGAALYFEDLRQLERSNRAELATTARHVKLPRVGKLAFPQGSCLKSWSDGWLTEGDCEGAVHITVAVSRYFDPERLRSTVWADDPVTLWVLWRLNADAPRLFSQSPRGHTGARLRATPITWLPGRHRLADYREGRAVHVPWRYNIMEDMLRSCLRPGGKECVIVRPPSNGR